SRPASLPVHNVEGRRATVQPRPPRSSLRARDRANPAPPPLPSCLSVRFRASPSFRQPPLLEAHKFQGSEGATTPREISVEMLRTGSLGSRAFHTWVMSQKGQIARESSRL